jgi:hypothetical protein
MISGFLCEADENYTLLGTYGASSGNSWPDILGQPVGPKTSGKNYHYSMHNSPEERSSHL